MNSLNLLGKTFGGWWAGIRIHNGTLPDGRFAQRPMRFCEAISEARTGPIIITPKFLDCIGGQRSFGWNKDDEGVIQNVASKTGIERELVRAVVLRTPRLDTKITGITVGTDIDPDVAITFAQPESAMRLINFWQRIHGTVLMVEVSTFMSVCGSVAVRAYVSGNICLSFGCPDSRGYGKIGRDRLIIGIPTGIANEIVNHRVHAVQKTDSYSMRPPMEIKEEAN